MAQQQMTSSQKALMLELKSLQEEPVEGFRITLVDDQTGLDARRGAL